MDIDDADRFRRQAEVCREESAKALSLVDAAAWLRLADDFDMLAKRAQQSRKGGRPPSLWIDSAPSR